MIRSWFAIFIYLAAAVFLAYYQYWHLALFITAILLLTGIYSEKYSREAFTGTIVIIAGMLYCHLVTDPVPDRLPEINNVTITGKVSSYPRYDGEKSSFVLRVDSNIPYQQKLQVFCYFNAGVRRGDEVRLEGSLKPPARPGNPGEFDYAARLAYDRIYYILFVQKADNVEIISPYKGLKKWFSSYRLQGEKIIYGTLPQEEAEILLGMLLGKKEAVEAEQYRDFQKIGIVHIFAVSGLHVGFLLLLSAWLTSLFDSSRKIKFCFSLCLLFIYGSIVGWPVSVMRASLMAALGLFAYYMGRENSLLNSLGIAGTVILLLNPCDLFKISFQLSFLATWGLIYLFPLLKEKLGYKTTLWDLVLIPFCTQIAVIPLIAFYFNLFTPVAVISNIAIAYVAGVAVILGFLGLLVIGVFPVFASFLFYPAGFLIELILMVSGFLQGLPFAFLWVATPSIEMIITYYTGLLLVVSSLRGSFNRGVIAGLVLIVFFGVSLCLPAGYYNRGIMEAVFVDVGQGDSILLKTPQGKFLLIDGGGSAFYDVGERRVLPYLRYRGIRELFIVFNTHPDTDHLQGLETVVAEMPVHFVAVPKTVAESDSYQFLKKAALKKKIPFIALQSGQVINIEKGLNIEVLHPQEGKASQSSGFNDHSLVLRIQYQDFSVLITGDIEKDSLQSIMKNEGLLPVTVVKVPHHGSSDSLIPEFYDKTRPEWAVISVGNNNFGHPHEAVLKTLEGLGIKVLRTDIHGAVEFRSDGRTVKISTYIADAYK